LIIESAPAATGRDLPPRRADGIGRGRAGRDVEHRRAAEAMLGGDAPHAGIGRRLQEGRRIATRWDALGAHELHHVGHGEELESHPHRDRGVRAIEARTVALRILDRRARGAQAEVHLAVATGRLTPVVTDLGGDACGELRGIEERDRTRGRISGEEALAIGGEIVPERRHDAHAGDRDALHAGSQALRTS
jgi:hypothetical protein